MLLCYIIIQILDLVASQQHFKKCIFKKCFQFQAHLYTSIPDSTAITHTNDSIDLRYKSLYRNKILHSFNIECNCIMYTTYINITPSYIKQVFQEIQINIKAFYNAAEFASVSKSALEDHHKALVLPVTSYARVNGIRTEAKYQKQQMEQKYNEKKIAPLMLL